MGHLIRWASPALLGLIVPELWQDAFQWLRDSGWKPHAQFVCAVWLLLVVAYELPVSAQQKKLKGYRMGSTLIVAILCGAAWWWLLVRSEPSSVQPPAIVTAAASAAERMGLPPVAGMRWSSKFSELRVRIYNQSDVAITDVNVLVKPNEPVVSVAQLTSLPGFTFAPNGDPLVNDLTVVRKNTERAESVPTFLVATNTGYRVTGERLAGRTSLEFVMAIGSLSAHLAKKQDSLTILTANYRDGAFWYGFGNTVPDEWFDDRRAATSVSITGAYSFKGERFDIEMPDMALADPLATIRQAQD